MGAFSSDSKSIITLGRDGKIRFWNIADGELQRHFDATAAERMAVSHVGPRLALTSRAHTIRQWNHATGDEFFAQLTGHNGPISALSLSADGKTLVSGSHIPPLDVWNPVSGKRIRSLNGIKATQLQFLPDGQHFVSMYEYDPDVILWDSASGRETRVFRHR